MEWRQRAEAVVVRAAFTLPMRNSALMLSGWCASAATQDLNAAS